MWKFKKKSLKLDLYTHDNGYFINDKPTLKRDTPSWYKSLTPTVKCPDGPTNSEFDVGTAKGCPGIKNLMTNGIKFHLWEPLKLRIHPDGRVEQLPLGIESKGQPFVQHFPLQYTGLYPKNATAFKLNTPWLGVCKEETSFIFMESHFSTNFIRENNLYVAPGYIDFKYQHSLNCHIVVAVEFEPYDIEFPYGLPLFTLYPVTERELEIEHHLISKDEYARLTNEFPQCPARKYYQLIKNINP